MAQVFFASDPANVGDEKVTRIQPECAAVGFAAEGRMKFQGVDSAAPDPSVGDPPHMQVLLIDA